MLKIFGRRGDIRVSLRQMLTCLNSLTVNLLRYNEMRGFSPPTDEERKLRLDMALSDLRDYKSLMDNIKHKLSSPELSNAIDVVRSFAVISEVEGADFVITNLEGIVRSARWAIANIEKARRGKI